MCFRVQFSFSWPENLFCLFFCVYQKNTRKRGSFEKKSFQNADFSDFLNGPLKKVDVCLNQRSR